MKRDSKESKLPANTLPILRRGDDIRLTHPAIRLFPYERRKFIAMISITNRLFKRFEYASFRFEI